MLLGGSPSFSGKAEFKLTLRTCNLPPSRSTWASALWGLKGLTWFPGSFRPIVRLILLRYGGWGWFHGGLSVSHEVLYTFKFTS